MHQRSSSSLQSVWRCPLPRLNLRAQECAKKGLWDGLCWINDTKTWALHAGQSDYNTKNPCCLRNNWGGSQWSKLAVTKQAQDTMLYLFRDPVGRAHYATYMGLLARSVRAKPAAIGIELMNVRSIQQSSCYATFELCLPLPSWSSIGTLAPLDLIYCFALLNHAYDCNRNHQLSICVFRCTRHGRRAMMRCVQSYPSWQLE